MTHLHAHLIVLQAVEQVSPDRLQKAVCGLANGTLTVSLIRQSPFEVRGYVQHGQSKEPYEITLTAARAWCSCPDALFRHAICKHAVALALTVLRHPRPETKRTYQLGDLVHHDGHTGKVICVSGEYISVAWDNGRIAPLTRGQLEDRR